MAERFLLVRLGALGDIVHAIPVAAALRRALPSARIDWLVSAKHREILDLVSVLDRRLVINDRPSASGPEELAPRNEDSRGSSFRRAIGELRRRRYDTAIDLQGLLKSAVLARASGAPRVVGFASSYLRERLARFFYTDVYDPGCQGLYDPREARHVVQINLGLLQPLGIAPGPAEFPIEQPDSAVARRLRDLAGDRYALLNPGAAWPNKRWPPSRFGAVAAWLRLNHGMRSVVLWGPGEEGLAEEVVASSEDAAVPSPPTTIADLVALARGAAILISGDTGPMHIAAALGTPIVGLYGPTRPQRNGPWAADDITISRDAVCQCHHLRRCKLAAMCLLEIHVEDVTAAINRRLAVEARPVAR